MQLGQILKTYRNCTGNTNSIVRNQRGKVKADSHANLLRNYEKCEAVIASGYFRAEQQAACFPGKASERPWGFLYCSQNC